jgi:hypothetical protein
MAGRIIVTEEPVRGLLEVSGRTFLRPRVEHRTRDGSHLRVSCSVPGWAAPGRLAELRTLGYREGLT